ncbi:MAG: hypothetical protein HPY54_11470 [Chthonomonadetes bacterium]|nr:hypothetical protein [Chthonomonadetes bacterium]
MTVDIGGALWIIAVVVVFLGVSFGLPEASVAVLEKVYALCLMAGLVWLARGAASTSEGAKGARRRD